MSEQTVSYSYGTEVWVKLFNRYWWPGVVVDPLTIPDDLLEYVNKVNPIAVVKFEKEQKYEVVLKNDKILLYSCPLKMELVKKGYSLHKSQEKGTHSSSHFDMQHFLTDVLTIEKRIGGDILIFEKIDKAQEQLKSIIQGFTPEIKKPKKRGRKSLQELQELQSLTSQTKPSRSQSKSSTPQSKPSTPQSKPSTSQSKQSTPQSKQSPAQKQKSLPPSRAIKLRTPIRTSVSNGYACHVHVNCTYSTNRYDLLKRHMATHKNDTKEETVKKLPSSNANKRKNLKNKISDAKKIKLQDELLKDWENDGDDEDEELDTSNVSTIIEDKQSTSEIAPTMAEVMPKTSEVLPSITNKVQEANINPDKILDLNENNKNTPVIEQRQSQSGCSSTVDDISDKFEMQLTSDCMKKTILEISPKESVLVEEIKKDPSNEPCEIYSNEFANEIDDQTKITELLLEKTVNTLDHINHFESSLSGISNTINKSDSNTLTKDDNIIGVSETEEFDSLNEPTSTNKDIYTEANSNIDIVENITIQIENREINEEKTIDIEVVPDDVEMNQPNDETIDKSMPIEDSCSMYSISNEMSAEDVTTAENDNGEPLINDVGERDWTKNNGWPPGLRKANSYSAELKLPTSHEYTLPEFLK
ncbi:muscle M-line assembly protein unc-89-like isoform X2 [Rhopalosiphum maidis]|uniref:muscle M-line assembly protein unc-89-like isoform X2 n=1 Tax=Rhopalosiphum maidis TaxID=43146 RepID=UPI000EFE8687|nr:muscle M-line assembly protein unc-89-like isoform X2 [Rhopalosiphum maidis]